MASSGVSESIEASQNNVPQQCSPKTENNKYPLTFMDSNFYRAAAESKIDCFKDTNNKELINLGQLLTPNRNTVLHIHITAATKKKTTADDDEKSIKFMEEVLKLCPELLLQANAKKEIPLHMAARYGHVGIVDFLIKRAKLDGGHHQADDPESGRNDDDTVKQMLRTTNKEKDTALHEAVRFKHNLKVVEMLTKEDPDFPHPVNEAHETPLYMAAERKYSDLVEAILNNCSSPTSSGPNGRTALHAAIIAKEKDTAEAVLNKLKCLTQKEDDEGWIPLHFAAKMNCLDIVELLLRDDKSMAYKKTKEGMTALHIAASHDYDKIVKEIIWWCPDCCELVDDRGRNVLHYAIQYSSLKSVRLLLNDSSLSNLINQKDELGNTPFLHMATSLKYFSERFFDDSRVDRMAFNIQNQNFSDIVSTDRRVDYLTQNFLKTVLHSEGIWSGQRIRIRKVNAGNEISNEEESTLLSNLEKAKESTLVAATLIATVTFAAGFTLPGGYVSDGGPLQGAALLRESTAFQAFMITDTIAMVLSTVAVFINLFLIMQQDTSRKASYYILSFQLTTLAMAGMVIAFVTGTYAVLAHSTPLAAAICVIGLSFFVCFCFLYQKTDITDLGVFLAPGPILESLGKRQK